MAEGARTQLARKVLVFRRSLPRLQDNLLFIANFHRMEKISQRTVVLRFQPEDIHIQDARKVECALAVLDFQRVADHLGVGNLRLRDAADRPIERELDGTSSTF